MQLFWWPTHTYSEQKNCLTKGQILLVGQIVGQGTKLNLWEFLITKIDILSFVAPTYRTLVPSIGLIYILQCHTLCQSVFLPVLGLALFDLLHPFYPSGHALNHISINLPLYSIPLHPHLLPKPIHTSSGGSHASSCLLSSPPKCSIVLRSGDCPDHFTMLMLIGLNSYEAF